MSALVGSMDRYLARESPIHRADARVKLPATLLTILAISLTQEGAWGVLLLMAAPIALVAALARGFRDRDGVSSPHLEPLKQTSFSPRAGRER